MKLENLDFHETFLSQRPIKFARFFIFVQNKIQMNLFRQLEPRDQNKVAFTLNIFLTWGN